MLPRTDRRATPRAGSEAALERPALQRAASLSARARGRALRRLPLAAQVGPFANPSELYQYYSLPFCRPTEIEEKWLDLGEVLKGDRAHKTLCAHARARQGGCAALGALAHTAVHPRWRARPLSRRYEIKYGEDVQPRPLCTVTLDADKAARFRQAIADDYYFEVRAAEGHTGARTRLACEADRRVLSR